MVRRAMNNSTRSSPTRRKDNISASVRALNCLHEVLKCHMSLYSHDISICYCATSHIQSTQAPDELIDDTLQEIASMPHADDVIFGESARSAARRQSVRCFLFCALQNNILQVIICFCEGDLNKRIFRRIKYHRVNSTDYEANRWNFQWIGRYASRKVRKDNKYLQ